MKTYRVLGLMSGSSLDGLDIAHCRFTVSGSGRATSLEEWELLQAETLPFSEHWKTWLMSLPKASALELVHVHAEFGHYTGQLVNEFLVSTGVKHQDIDLIASHGHTIFHDPSRKFTTQIGDGAAIAALTHCTVVCDFRSSDIALGGQGAPLAAFADKTLFKGSDFYLNLGGISNITCDANGRYVAFDIGAANQMLNALAEEMGKPFDRDGEIASQGNLDKILFDQLNSQPYFRQPYPKSLSNQWVQENAVQTCLKASGTVADRLRTACEHAAFQIAASIRQIIDLEGFKKGNYKIFATGGGALNTFLMSCIKRHCSEIADMEIVLPAAEIIQFKEALLMALLGVMRLENAPNCLASVTNASKDAIGGAVYAAQ